MKQLINISNVSNKIQMRGYWRSCGHDRVLKKVTVHFVGSNTR